MVQKTHVGVFRAKIIIFLYFSSVVCAYFGTFFNKFKTVS